MIPTVRLMLGNVIDQLALLPDASVHCVVTSPPYWGLRDYSTTPQVWAHPDFPLCDNGEHEWTAYMRTSENKRNNDNSLQLKSAYYKDKEQAFCCKCFAWRGDLGLEPTPELYVQHLVVIFREVRRALRDDGTVWLNLGDSFAGSGAGGGGNRKGNEHGQHDAMQVMGRPKIPNGVKPKDLIGIPWRTAFALQADGWYLRSDIIWNKPNPMPESVTDRPTKSHEYIFLLTKSRKYYYDADAIREPLSEATLKQIQQGYNGKATKDYASANAQDPSATKSRIINGLRKHTNQPTGGGGSGFKGHSGNFAADGTPLVNPRGRNKRSVWTVTTRPYAGAHFATFPPELIRPCIQAGTSQHGVCPECGAPWERIVERVGGPPKGDHRKRDDFHETPYNEGAHPTGTVTGGALSAIYREYGYPENNTTGWQPTCDHTLDPIPATVLDIFNGAGTTGLVSLQEKRSYIGIELNPDYLELARQRLEHIEPPKVKKKREVEHVPTLTQIPMLN